ncbi:hypothetical protein PMI42_07942 [Bradyrhizobium sp. YR681]|uniref:DUF4255 domain-containing protein n=1 Tax=Bradyrhizobium sp. YR681 TaxID=1144344 RepID=UPI00026F51E5|nr:DUF4255 domain-containing protein [Bradyrhizobium sp. YR681]EJN07230.1 hypothetical protein PMI42_07942 [Bradyrhizobium sp. YR681]
MSSPLAIGAVSAVLRNLLDNGMIEAGPAVGGTVNVSAVAPDTIDLTGAEELPRLNLFLYQVTPNPVWRNRALPSRSASSGERLTNAPLALDLHYLLTAYARVDCQAEILLGYGMHLLHERPVLDRAAVQRALNPNPLDIAMLPPAFQALAAADLADQAELIKITPSVMGPEEMSRLWAAIQSHYRPSAAYVVSVVLIEAIKPAVSPLPVLSRGIVDPVTKRDRGVVVNPDMLPPLPTLFAATPQLKQAGVRLGEPVVLTGIRLSGSNHRVRLAHPLFPVALELVPDAPNTDGTELTLTLPNDAAAQASLAPGQWSLTLRFLPAGEVNERETNAIALIIAPAPVITADASLSLPAATVLRKTAPLRVTATLFSRPQVQPRQRASLVLGTTEAAANPRAAATDPLVFDLPSTLPAGAYPVRLRVDGVDSLLLDLSGDAPAFDASQSLSVPT